MLFDGFIKMAQVGERKENRIFKEGYNAGVRDGIIQGIQKWANITSELTETETEMVHRFLIKHNIVFVYHSEIGARLRRNDKLNSRLPIMEYVSLKQISDDIVPKMEAVAMSIADAELMRLRCDEIDRSYR
jgi:hypothetical protein